MAKLFQKFHHTGTFPCGCKTNKDGDWLQCDLHEAAPMLLLALKNMHSKALKGQLKTLGDLNEAEDAMRKAGAPWKP